MRPRFPRIRRFVNAIASSKVRPLQAFTAADINYVRIGSSDGDRPHRTRALPVKNWLPRMTKIRGLPDAAIHSRHIENIRLMWHAGNGNRSAAAEGPDAAPAHLREEFLVVLLAECRYAHRN